LSQEALSVQLEKGQSDIAKMENAQKKITIVDLLAWMAALGVEYDRIHDILKPNYDIIVNKAKHWNQKNGD